MKNIGQSALLLPNLLSNTIYGWNVRMDCAGSPGQYSATSYFMTGVSTYIESIQSGHSSEMLLSVKAYPNPVRETIYIDCTTSKQATAEVSIMDLSSRIIYSTKINLVEGENNFPLDFSNLSSGVYAVAIKSENERKVIRVIVER